MLDREKKREYNRRWRRANLDKERAAKQRWRKANPDKVRAARRRWRKANPEKNRAQVKRWRKANPEKVRAALLRWRKANPDKVRARHRRRHARVAILLKIARELVPAETMAMIEARLHQVEATTAGGKRKASPKTRSQNRSKRKIARA